jgi:hypothetical protein
VCLSALSFVLTVCVLCSCYDFPGSSSSLLYCRLFPSSFPSSLDNMANEDGSEVPPLEQIVDNDGGVWTIAGHNHKHKDQQDKVLLNGHHAAGGFGTRLLWLSGAVNIDSVVVEVARKGKKSRQTSQGNFRFFDDSSGLPGAG